MSKLSRSIFILMLSRIAVNMARRFSYPFVPSLARQLNVSTTLIQSGIALQSSSGLAAPAIGPLLERYRRKDIMIFALSLMSGTALFAALIPNGWFYVLVLFLFGVGKTLYDPAVYAYIGDNVPYQRRGSAVGFIELSWALALAIVAPVGGLLLARSDVSQVNVLMLDHVGMSDSASLLVSTQGFQSVMVMFAVLCAAGAVLIALFVEGHPPKERQGGAFDLRVLWQTVVKHPPALAGVVYTFLTAAGNELLFINYGIYMEGRFALSLALLGSLTVVIAVAEVSGEFTVLFIADRIGKKRLTLIGLSLATLMYFILPFAPSLSFALVGLFLLFIGVETAIVASLPILTEVLPNDRIVMMNSVWGGAGLGRVSGAAIGGILYGLTGSIVVVGLTSTLTGIICFYLVWHYIEDRG